MKAKTILPLLICYLLCTFLDSCSKSATEQFSQIEEILIASETATIDNTQYFIVKKNDSKVWELLDTLVQGFTYQPGYEYLIQVKKQNDNEYAFVGLLSQTKKKSDQVPLFEGVSNDGIPDDSAELQDFAKIINRTNDYGVIFRGDMIRKQDQPNTLDTKSLFTTTRTHYWPYNTVYYIFDEDFDFNLRSVVSSAIAEWEDKTSLRFIYGTGNGNYLLFINDDWNHSYVGMWGGCQEIGLSPSSTSGTAMHEIGHAIGLEHEHCRPDRDNHIIVNWSNIDPTYQYAFDTVPSSNHATMGAIDFSSIMMYGSTAFAINYSQPTMTTRQGLTWRAQRLHLSDSDVDGVAAIYGPPYHFLEYDTQVIQDYTDGRDEIFERAVTYRICIYNDRAHTQPASLNYPRTINVYKYHRYYDTRLRRIIEDCQTIPVTLPAGTSSYSLGTYFSYEEYEMSNPRDVNVTTLNLDTSTMYN